MLNKAAKNWQCSRSAEVRLKMIFGPRANCTEPESTLNINFADSAVLICPRKTRG